MSQGQETFRYLYNTFRMPIYGFLRRSVGDEQTALDLMQDVFLNFIRIFKDKEIPDENRCRMYLFRAARNILINYYKSSYNRRVHLHDDPEKLAAPGSSSAVEASVIGADQKERAMRIFSDLLHHLNEVERNALILRFEHGMTIEQVAEVLDLSVTTAFRMLKKAKEQLVTEGKKIGFQPADLEW